MLCEECGHICSIDLFAIAPGAMHPTDKNDVLTEILSIVTVTFVCVCEG